MGFTDSFIGQTAFKKLFGLAHTEVKTFPLGNESNSSQLTIVSKDIYTETIPATAQAITGRIIACTNSTDAQSNSYLTVAQNLTTAPDGSGEGHPYLATVPAGHGLIGQLNPLTGLVYAQGDVVQSIIPKKFGTTWRPILYDATKTEIPPLSSLDWIIDERGFIVIRDNSTAPAYLSCYTYIGKTVADSFASALETSLSFVIDGGGSQITTGIKGFLEVPFDCNINRVTLLADQSGSIVVDIWKKAYATYPPTVSNTIISGAGIKPIISTSIKSQDSTLTAWDTSISDGDILAFNVDSINTITRCTIALKVTKSY